MSSSHSGTVEIGTKVCMARSCKSRVCDSLCIQSKSRFLRVILASRERARDDFGLETVPPTGLVFVRVFLTRWLAALSIRIMKDLLEVRYGLPLLDRGCRHVCRWT